MVLTGSKRAFDLMLGYYKLMGADVYQKTFVAAGETSIVTTVDYESKGVGCKSFTASFVQEYNRKRHQWFVRELLPEDLGE